MKTLTFEGLALAVRESVRRSTLELIVERDGSLILVTSPGVPQATLEAFVAERSEWLYTKLIEKEQQARLHDPRQYANGEGFYYQGHSYRLKIVTATEQKPPLRLYQGRFTLHQDALPQAREHFIQWYTRHLPPILGEHLANLTERIGATPREVHIQDLGYRWASANRCGHLYFHWRGAMLPYRMSEYRVAHELVHLRERYHASAFWERLERVLPDYEGRRDWLAYEGRKYDL